VVAGPDTVIGLVEQSSASRDVKCGPFGAANHDVIGSAIELLTVVEEVKSFGVFAARAAATGTFPRPTRCENRVIMDRLCGRNWLWGMVSFASCLQSGVSVRGVRSSDNRKSRTAA
jgi:hypothetical protein